MRVVFDTNILVLNLMGGGVSRTIIEAAFSNIPEQPLSFFYSPDVMAEYTGVLHGLPNDKPDVFLLDEVTTLLDEIRKYGHQIYPTFTLTGDTDACSHEPDNRILECAVAAQAEYIVTVNTRHFPESFRGVQTVLPSTFYNILID